MVKDHYLSTEPMSSLPCLYYDTLLFLEKKWGCIQVTCWKQSLHIANSHLYKDKVLFNLLMWMYWTVQLVIPDC